MNVIKTKIDFKNQKNSSNKYLLGTWCLNQKQNINDYKIIPYHWDDKEKLAKDYIYMTELYEKKLDFCYEALNKIHNTNFNKRYWRIVIGPWLRFFLDCIFDRYESIKYANENIKDAEFLIYDYKKDISPNNFKEFYENMLSDYWNEVIFSECIKAQNLNFSHSQHKLSNRERITKKNITIKNILIKVYGLYQKFISKFGRSITIISPYIPLKKLICLEAKLFNLPYFYEKDINLKTYAYSEEKRNQLLGTDSEDAFEDFINKQIPINIPKNYVEDYDEFKYLSYERFPKKTDVIYTSNAYQSYDAFKFWCAEQVTKGSKLIIGQHGGTFGISLLNQTEEHQIDISDYFLSWGWESNQTEKIHAIPSIKFDKFKSISKFQKNNGDIILTLGVVPKYFYNYFSMPIAGQYYNYMSDQITFLENLDHEVVERIRIRDDKSGIKWGWDIKSRLGNKFITNLTNSNPSLLNQIKGSSLCICTHNGTILLETLSSNFPTVIFWDSNIYEIRSDAIGYFKKLKDVGIFFDCPIKAAEHINNISNNILEWWNHHDVQKARELFISKYALKSENSSSILLNFLKQQRKK